MNERVPLIFAGQLYINQALNEYVIVTKNHLSQITYAGNGIHGQAADDSFIEKFAPVDPVDVDQEELASLLAYCPDGTKPTAGFIET